MSLQRVSITERVLHAVGYELILVVICAPVLSWASDTPIGSAGALTLALSAVAMAWNMAYNAMVDRCIKVDRIQWGFMGRVMHGLGFEAGMVIACVPLAAWMLDLSLWNAFLVELGFLAFVLPYTIAYNWSFDKAKHRFVVVSL